MASVCAIAIAILSEAYSYLSFGRRIEVTEAFVETLLAQIARRASEVKSLIDDLDRDTVSRRQPRHARAARHVRTADAVLRGASPILIGDVESQINPRSGRTMTVMKETVARLQLMQEYGFFAPVDAIVAPRAYAVVADGTGAVERDPRAARRCTAFAPSGSPARARLAPKPSCPAASRGASAPRRGMRRSAS